MIHPSCIHPSLFLPNLTFLSPSLDFIYLFLERVEGREKERKRNINVWLPLTHPHWGPGWQPDTCSDWASNWGPFGPQAGTQSTEPHQPGPNFIFLYSKTKTSSRIVITLIYPPLSERTQQWHSNASCAKYHDKIGRISRFKNLSLKNAV